MAKNVFSDIGTPVKETEEPEVPETNSPIISDTSKEEPEKPAGEPEKTKEPKPEAKPEINKYQIFSETFGGEIKSDEDIDKIKSSLTEWNEKKARLAEVEQENEALRKEFKPEGIFANEKSKERFKNLVIHDQLMTKLPGKDPEILFDVISRDYSKSHKDDPIGVLVKDLMLDNPEIFTDEETAEAAILEKYHIDTEDKDENGVINIPQSKKSNMQVDAKSAVAKWNGYKTQVELPKNEDLSAKYAKTKELNEERITRITQATEPLFKKVLPEKLKAIEIPVTTTDENGKEVTEVAFRYDIPEGFVKSKAVQDFLTATRNNIIQNATEFNDQLSNGLEDYVLNQLHGMYRRKHDAEIYAAMQKDLFSKFKDEAYMKRHNPRPLNQNAEGEEKPKVKGDSGDKVMGAFGLK